MRSWSIHALFAALALLPLPCHAVGVFECMMNALSAERLESKYAESDRDLYFQIHDPDLGFSQHPYLREKAFTLLAGRQAPASVTNQFFRRDPVALDRALDELEKLPEATRSEVLRDPNRTNQFWEKIAPKDGTIGIHEPVTYNGKVYSKASLENAQAIQKQLQSQGVETEIASGKMTDDLSSGQAFLKITRVKDKLSGDKIRASGSTFKSSRFNSYLKDTAEQGGGIYIDPGLGRDETYAYFQSVSPEPGEKWRICLGKNATWSDFTHEWEHKLDYVDRKGRFPDSLYDKTQAQASYGSLKRAAIRAGKTLEARHISELNATAAQFRLYFETASASPKDAFDLILYRASNQKKVAIGRILQDPRNPRHYALYIGSRVMLYGPASVVIYAAIHWINGDTNKASQE